MKDNINPSHYKESCSLECIDSMMIAFGDEYIEAFCEVNAYKYLWRCKQKNGIEDVNKALWYLDYATSEYGSNERITYMYRLANKLKAELSKKPIEHKTQTEDACIDDRK